MLEDVKYLVKEISRVAKKNENNINTDAVRYILDCCAHLEEYAAKLEVHNQIVKEKLKQYGQVTIPNREE